MYKILALLFFLLSFLLTFLFASSAWIHFTQSHPDNELTDEPSSKSPTESTFRKIVGEPESHKHEAPLMPPLLAEASTPAVNGSIGWEEAGCVERLVYLKSGESMFFWDCPSKEVKHPYTAYPTASLEALAYGDAKAAEILGKRFAETAPIASLEWMLRASALNKGDYEPILYLVNSTYAAVDINGDFPAETVANKYVLAGVISRLGGPQFPLQSTRKLLLENGFEISELTEFDHVAKILFDKIAAISLEVTGEEILQEDDHV